MPASVVPQHLESPVRSGDSGVAAVHDPGHPEDVNSGPLESTSVVAADGAIDATSVRMERGSGVISVVGNVLQENRDDALSETVERVMRAATVPGDDGSVIEARVCAVPEGCDGSTARATVESLSVACVGVRSRCGEDTLSDGGVLLQGANVGAFATRGVAGTEALHFDGVATSEAIFAAVRCLFARC